MQFSREDAKIASLFLLANTQDVLATFAEISVWIQKFMCRVDCVTASFKEAKINLRLDNLACIHSTLRIYWRQERKNSRGSLIPAVFVVGKVDRIQFLAHRKGVLA